MKLHTEPKFRRDRATELLRQEAEPEFDLRAVVAIKTEDMRRQLFEAQQNLTPLAYMKGSLYRLASIRTLERTLGVVIVPPAANNTLDQRVHDLMNHVSELVWATIENDPKRLAALAAWVQLFPEERDLIPFDDHRFDRVMAMLRRSTNSLGLMYEAVFLLHLRPDKREQIRELISATYYQEFVIDQFKQPYLLNESSVEAYTEWMADYLLIHPEDRQQFAPTEAERKIIQQALLTRPIDVHPTGGRLRDAAIIFGDDARIDDRGVIQIAYAAPQIGSKQQELPVRSNL